jgi:hypothetical protein
MSNNFKPLDKAWLVALMAVSLTACGGGGGDNPPPSGNNPPPAPAPTPPPPPPPPPSPALPPLAATAVDISAGQRIGDVHWSSGDTPTGGQGAPVGSLTCGPEDTTYHAHAHVSILLNNEPLAVPTRIGIVENAPNPRCLYQIHTHDASGKIHVEAAAAGTFTLGQLFQVWGQPLTTTDVAGLTGMPVEVFVTDGGVVTKVDADWANIELRSKRLITIGVGTPVTEIPNFTWSGD